MRTLGRYFLRHLALSIALVVVYVTTPISAYNPTTTRKSHNLVSSSRALIPNSELLGVNTDVTPDLFDKTDLLTDFLADAGGLGAVRFVVVGTGAILETVGSFENLRYADTVKGKLATVSSENPCFECHIRLAEVKEVRNVVVEKFEKMLRITRFLGEIGSHEWHQNSWVVELRESIR